MYERTPGVVLRLYPLTETSLIVHWLTPGFGRLTTVAKGARRPKSPFGGKLDLFYAADFSFSRSRRSELHTLCEVSLKETHSALRRELGYLRQASYCAALVEQTTERETPLPAIFDLMGGLLNYLPSTAPAPQSLFAFELKLLGELGLGPDWERGAWERGSVGAWRLSAGSRQIARALGGGDGKGIALLKPSAAQTTELGQFLHRFLIFHLGKIPGGRGAALEVGGRRSEAGPTSDL